MSLENLGYESSQKKRKIVQVVINNFAATIIDYNDTNVRYIMNKQGIIRPLVKICDYDLDHTAYIDIETKETVII